MVKTSRNTMTTRSILAMAVLSVSAIGIVAVAELFAATPGQVAFAQQTATGAANNYTLSGIITSTQLNQAGAPQWLTAGSWRLATDKPVFGTASNQTQQPTVKNFSAVIVMTTINNGTVLHSHRISDFKLLGVTHPGGNTPAFNGTMTVTTENGPTQNVPGFLDFQNNRMSIWVNPGAIQNHFGPNPINGMTLNPQQLQEIRSLELPSAQQGAQQITSAAGGNVTTGGAIVPSNTTSK